MSAESWAVRGRPAFVGRRIVEVGHVGAEQTRRVLRWSLRPPMLILEGGEVLYASLDAEGNDAGAFRSTARRLPVLPPIPLD
jgi:hypothetical protein